MRNDLEGMMEKDVQLIVFNVQNNQEDYSVCLDFIKTYENTNKPICEKIQPLLEIARKYGIVIREFDEAASYRWIEEPIQKKGETEEEALQIFEQKFRNEITLDEKIICFLLEQKKKLHYHVRIHMDYEGMDIKGGTLVHFQYLALMLQRLSVMGFFCDKLKRELTVFLVPTTGEIYPFCNKEKLFDAKSYNVVSQYLRLIAKKFTGIIFCADNSKEGVKVHALETHSTRGCESYFPVIMIDAEMYDNLFAPCVEIEFYEALRSKQKGKARGDFGQASNRNPILAMPDFVTKTAYKKFIKTFPNDVDELFVMLNNVEQKSIMQFCLFTFLLHHECEFNDVWELAGEIERGIRQVVQNAIQHSETHECIFSFYLHQRAECKDANNYIDELSKQYPLFFDGDAQKEKGALEIFVSDLNEKQDMLDSFHANLQQDIDTFVSGGELSEQFSGHQMLINDIEKIAIRNLFSEFSENDLKDVWTQFRKQDIVAHVGLSLFALTAERCNAAIKVISSKESKISNDRSLFYKVYGIQEETAHKIDNKKIIPGTQFSILIPTRLWSNIQGTTIGQLVFKDRISEDYRSYAHYLDYEEKRIPITRRSASGEFTEKKQQAGSMTNRDDKNMFVKSWYVFWKKRLMGDCNQLDYEKRVYNHDFESVCNDSYFNDTDKIEVCIKGLIMSLNEINMNGHNLYFALTNLPKGFIKSFCNIAILLGVREFPRNMQIYFCERMYGNGENNQELILIGGNFMQVMHHAYILSLEHGTLGCTYDDYKKTIEVYRKIAPLSTVEESVDRKTFQLCPFDTLLKVNDCSDETLFEQKIRLLAENELDGVSAGYKLNQTHMRLGSKVHIESFYEMSFLFYRTSIANRIAFLIIKDLYHNSNNGFDLKKDAIIFYGYASYSKAILTSLTEILRYWRDDEDKGTVGFASYQHNLHSDSNEIQMYFGVESDMLGIVNDKNVLELTQFVKIVQIVPISSTLTTFGKMWSEFLCHLQTNHNVAICGNYTIFWVVDQASSQPGIIPSEVEKRFWISVNKRNIQTTFLKLCEGGCDRVRYFMLSKVAWHDPLYCPLCFPNNVVEEVPLVETDPTSTVPAQQIRYKNEEHISNVNSQELRTSILRLKKLKKCILHGHITRRQNHYQYYVDTQRYFYNVKEDVMIWLRQMREKEKLFHDEYPTLHIIFSPEHNTNVGFAQYVNTYYFDGLAEIVSINVDKEYRSNFVCEHAALKRMIEYLHTTDDKSGNLPVRFYFVDDTIITGETLEKANNFLHSLIPSNVKNSYHANLFEKIFLLIDRLSNDSKYMYVEDVEKNFHSFVHIDVSNIRTQGDSCVGCKLEKNTKKMLKRSATRQQAEHWSQKMSTYKKISFDNLMELEKIDRTHSFWRMMIYHVLQNVLVKKGKAYNVGDAYDILLDLMEWFLYDGEKGDIYGYQDLFDEMDKLNGIQAVLKIMCRPFFSFDYKIKLQVLTLYICLTECLLNTENNSDLVTEEKQLMQKKFLLEKKRKERTVEIANRIREQFVSVLDELDFLCEYMFEGLTELGSTYLMRKQSIQKVYLYLSRIPRALLSDEKNNEVWRSYALNIHRLLSNTKDETKEVWMEYLYSLGEEFSHNKNYFSRKNSSEVSGFPALYNAIAEKSNANRINEGFKWFVLGLFLQNTGVNFDGIEKRNELDASDEYFMKSWNEMRELGRWILHCDKIECGFISEERLFCHIKDRQVSKEENKSGVREWYETLLELIANMAEEKYDIKSDEVNIILLTENLNYEDADDTTQRLDVISEWHGYQVDSEPVIRYTAKTRLKEALDSSNGFNSMLEKSGYVLYDGEEENNYFILFFDNPEIEKGEIKEGSLARVFLYMSIRNRDTSRHSVGIRYIMRDILAYRNRLLRILEQDFYGDTFINYARANGEKNILLHEKAASHSASTDDEISMELFVRKDIDNEKIYSNLENSQKAYWLLIRNYTNNQIAKLFNRSFQDETIGEIPPLYISSSVECGCKHLFAKQLNTFENLGIVKDFGNQDGRFEWIQKIMYLDIDLGAHAEFVKSDTGLGYNLEYFKCILVDIFLSAIKFQSYQKDDFLMRIDEFMGQNTDGSIKEKLCAAKIYRLKSDDNVDELVIENPVKKLAHGLADWKERNKITNMRLNDPLDFVDGHMSLLTIKRYIEQLGATKRTCRFEYSIVQDDFGENKLVFITCLPVLKKEE